MIPKEHIPEEPMFEEGHWMYKAEKRVRALQGLDGEIKPPTPEELIEGERLFPRIKLTKRLKPKTPDLNDPNSLETEDKEKKQTK